MSEINLGQINLTPKQISRMSEAHIEGVKGYRYKRGEITVNHEKDSLSDSEKSAIVSALTSLPDEDTDRVKRLQELKAKPTLTLPEVTEVLRLRGLL